MKILEYYKSLEEELSKIASVKLPDLSLKVYENSSGVYFTLDEFLSQYNPESLAKGQCNLIFRVDVGQRCITSFQLKDMYNCCGIIVLSDMFVEKKLRNLGIGKLITDFLIKFSTHYGYGVLQAADLVNNEPMVKIFERFEFTKGSEFVNKKTENKLAIWLKNLN